MSKTYIFMNYTPPPASLAHDKRDAWMPKGDVPYYDKMMRMRFESRVHKRQVLRRCGMREAGETLKPSKGLGGTEGAMTRSKARRVS